MAYQYPDRDKQLAKARKAAVNKLIAAHKEEFTKLMLLECKLLRIDPPRPMLPKGTLKAGRR